MFKNKREAVHSNCSLQALLRKNQLGTFFHSFIFTLKSLPAQAQSAVSVHISIYYLWWHATVLTPSSLTVCPCRVAEKEPINKMSLHNLATVFGPTLLRPSESESTKGQNITSASDIWSHDVMAQVLAHSRCWILTFWFKITLGGCHSQSCSDG